MTTINIALPDDMQAWVEREARSTGCSDTAEFVRGLLRDEKKRKDAAHRKLDSLLIAGLESGEPQLVTPDWWMRLQQELETELMEQ